MFYKIVNQVIWKIILNSLCILLVLTSGGNSNGQSCFFPFKYQSSTYDSCINDGTNYWCSSTSDFDQDKIKGNCNPGNDVFLLKSWKVIIFLLELIHTARFNIKCPIFGM